MDELMIVGIVKKLVQMNDCCWRGKGQFGSFLIPRAGDLFAKYVDGCNL